MVPKAARTIIRQLLSVIDGFTGVPYMLEIRYIVPVVSAH